MSNDLMTTWEDDDNTIVPTPAPATRDVYHQIVYQMWEGGVRDMKEIVAETGYTAKHIRTLLAERGYELVKEPTHTQAELSAICSDYLAMRTVRDVLKKWNISNNTLYNILDAQGVPLKRRARGNMDEAVDMYTAGEPLKDIHNGTGVAAPNLYQELSARGIQTRSVEKDVGNMPAVEEALRMYSTSATLMDIYIKTGVPLNRIYRELALRGIPRRRSPDTEKKVDRAIDLYTKGERVVDIQQAVGVSATVIYKGLAVRGIDMRQGRAQGDADEALKLYDEGATAKEIMKVARVSHIELLSLIRKRGGRLRTGLVIDKVSRRHVDMAVEAYKQNVDIETIEIDTLVKRPELYAELKRQKIGIRP